jgi:hypothetical protein
MNLLEILIISALSISLIVSLAILAANSIKNKKNLESIAQLFIDRSAMSEEIDRLSFIANNSSDINDGFVKFLSESRDVAFDYISEVQLAIESLKTAMDLDDAALISDAYEKLKSFLPSESQDVLG